MWCPQCRYEYRVGIVRCPECEVEMVERLEEPDRPTPADTAGFQPPPGDLVSVLKTEKHFELIVVRALLEGADIPVSVKGEFAGTLKRHFGPMELQVPREHAELARRLLEAEPIDGFGDE